MKLRHRLDKDNLISIGKTSKFTKSEMKLRYRLDKYVIIFPF